MDSNRKLAIELAMALIQNSHVTPSFNHSLKSDIGDENIITYKLGDSKYSFCELVSHYLDNLEKIKKWK